MIVLQVTAVMTSLRSRRRMSLVTMLADWSLTNHQRLGSCLQPRRTELTGRAQAPVTALRPRVPVLVAAHRPGMEQPASETQQTGLFQLRRDRAALLLWVIQVLRPRHEDRQLRPSWHLETSGAICHRGNDGWRADIVNNHFTDLSIF